MVNSNKMQSHTHMEYLNIVKTEAIIFVDNIYDYICKTKSPIHIVSKHRSNCNYIYRIQNSYIGKYSERGKIKKSSYVNASDWINDLLKYEKIHIHHGYYSGMNIYFRKYDLINNINNRDIVSGTILYIEIDK